MTDKTPDDVIQHAAKIIRDANGSRWQRYETAAHDLADAGLLRTAQDDLDLWDAKRIKAERDELRATVEHITELAFEHNGCSGCQTPWWLRVALDGAGEQ